MKYKIPTFSDEQKTLIHYLAAGYVVEVCTEVCPDLGSVAELNNYPGHFNQRSLFRLKREGLLKEKHHYHSGLRWTRLALNEKGLTVANAVAQPGENRYA
ncbi:hypothetical protein L2725_04750 [Shewanella corallii]|uniref:Transposase n=1 Tax=Shewanella corallii TaxID=560080 RepID=A0ABT0N3R0_9GAMM|nr:hypothetical protein [Shewanella corallii]MCL2913093.1 hypothetical protein [Shewanella corallii]